jgi:hypothetical protein
VSKDVEKVFDPRKAIGVFKASKGTLVPLFSDSEWMSDFGYLIDITLLLNNLNLQLYGRDNLVHNLFDHIKSFDNKIQVWKLQLSEGNFTHFPSLSECMDTVTAKYTLAVAYLRPEFSNMSTDFKSHK